MCKETGCANFVQIKLAPESVQTLCKDFGPPWRVAGLWRVPAITGRPKGASGGLKLACGQRRRLTQHPQQTLRVNRMHRRKIGFVESQQQGVLVHVQQVLVGSHQQGNFRQRSFGQNQAVVKFVFRNQTLPEQAANEWLANGFRRGIQSKGRMPRCFNWVSAVRASSRSALLSP